MPGQELDIAAVRKQLATVSAKIQVDLMSQQIDVNSRGEFFIEDISWTDVGSDKLTLLNFILHELLIRYPTMEFRQYESLKPSERGMLIKWSPRWVPTPIVRPQPLELEN